MTPEQIRLEELSEMVRKGHPVHFLEAIAVINYQQQLQSERAANSLRARFMRWIKKIGAKP